MTTLTKLGDLPASVGTAITAGDISPDGTEIILRNNKQPDHADPAIRAQAPFFYWTRTAGETVFQAMSREPIRVANSLRQDQGEAICWAHDGSGYYTSSEGAMRLDRYLRDCPYPETLVD